MVGAVTGGDLEVEAAAEEACEKLQPQSQGLVLLVKSWCHFPPGESDCEELASSANS
jgi:hypothetical protein